MRDFNFFAAYIITKQKGQKRIVILMSFVLLAAFIVFAVFTMSYAFGHQRMAVLYEIDANMLIISNPGTAARLDQYRTLNSRLNDLKTYNQAVEQLTNQIQVSSTINTHLFNDITANMPLGVSLVSLDASGNIINMTGTGTTEAIIAEFEHNLRALTYVNDVFVSRIAEITTNAEYVFSLTVNVRDVAGNVADAPLEPDEGER